ncbi:ROK family transcriptional regulator [Virgibacillus dokdonensis]|uniref:N-acetylglucosamine repressor n=1 Tax=Virgibacillus dokdonensis TaxID=302167 RepID=A0A2K9IW29_9BACI|nr:ROK family transcriptional regulator [Virgibacillus dokdonensis]AUJ23959.1 N-acetylglucosamine repressor [Virgibacillus dokdonensis]
MQRGTFQLMKSVNKSIILNKIRTCEPISRAQIAKETELTPPTVSSIVKELLEQGMVYEQKKATSMGGRRPTMLYINKTAYYLVGVDAGPEKIKAIVADLGGRILGRISYVLNTPITEASFLDVMKQSINEVVRHANVKMEEVMGIGVAMHGVVEIATGRALYAPNLQLTDIPIKEALEQEFRVTVKVENDARAMALGEAWFGGHGDLGSMVTVNLGRGVGAGIVTDGKLFHGAKDIAGEIGHMTIDINGEICECGNRGCLQTFATGSAIAMRAERKLAERGEVHSFKLTAESVFELAKSGNELYLDVLEETGFAIGIGLTNVIHIVNPGKIVLGGGVMKSEEFLLPIIKKTVNNNALTEGAKNTEVKVTKLGKDATVLGAVALLLVEIFDSVLG